MNPKLSAVVKAAVTLWTAGAVEHLAGCKEQLAELKLGMEGTDADVRIIYHVRAEAITMEVLDRQNRTFTEIFREELVPDDGGFAVPDTELKQ